MADRAWTRAPRGLLVLAGVGFVFMATPILGMLLRAPWGDAAQDLTSPAALTALRLSLEVSLAATGVAMIVGFPLAWVLARIPFPGRSVVRAVAILPLVLPPVVAGVALFAGLGRRGLIGRWLAQLGITLPFTTAGAVVAAAFVASPLLVLSLESGLRSLDSRLEAAATTMGASRWYVLRRVTLPLLRPQLIAGLVLTWARALGEFGATITFAGNLQGRTQTLPLAVYQILQSDPGGAIMVSLLLVAVSLVALVSLRGRILATG